LLASFEITAIFAVNFSKFLSNLQFAARNLQILARGRELTGIVQGLFALTRMMLD
jgi:hypothetical protein